MSKFVRLIWLFLIALFLNSCIYHERPETEYGALEILTDQQKKNIVHIIYKREGTHYFNDLRNGGGLKDVKYTYYVVHYQLLEDERTKTSMYRWFSESDKYMFYPKEDSLLRVLLRSGPALNNFKRFNELNQYKKYENHSFEHCRYQLDFPVKDSLYHWLGDSLVKSGYYSIKEMNRRALFGALDNKNDTLFSFKMDHTYDLPAKVLLPVGLSYYKFSCNTDTAYIALKNERGDSLFLYRFDASGERVGELISVKDISSLPAEIKTGSSELFVRNGKIELAAMKINYRLVYHSNLIQDFYYYGKELKHYKIPEDSVFRVLIKAK